jgi:S1-C subfamily serine protease
MRSPANDAAKMAEQSRQQSDQQFKAQMKLMSRQLKAQKALPVPAPEPMAPVATRANSDAVAQRREQARAAGRRYGFGQSVSSGSMLGSPTYL